MTSSNPKSILITGVSTGFGRATALHFARKGWRVFGTVRKEADRQALLDEKAGDLTPILCDIVDEAQVKALGLTVRAQTTTLDALVNNAGSAFPAPVELTPPDVLRQQFDLNVIAQVAVTQAVMPLIKAARGTIINVSSVGGRMTTPMLGPYSASKFALEALSDALRVELAPFGVKVVVIEPGGSPTAIWETSARRAQAMFEERGLDIGPYRKLIDDAAKGAQTNARAGFPAQLFADTVEKIVSSSKPRARYPIPPVIGWVILLRRWMPDEWWDAMLRRRLGW
jgi:NAD(P)-dependent dehydrogenase (short-subunit alcohol dehydrogenase family)